MNPILNNYDRCATTPSDINEHLPILKRYADLCESVTEMGVRDVCSTWSFLVSNASKIISYDINYNDNIRNCEFICKQEGKNWKFILDSSLTADIEQTDLLFIDTFHTYGQLKAELNKHHSKVNKWIIMHDTETFKYRSENDSPKGLMSAIEEFVIENKDIWQIKEIYHNNNGLTILERK